MGNSSALNAKLLQYFEMLEAASFSGEIVITASQGNAKVYFNRGLVVWAHAAGQRLAFQNILMKEFDFTKDELILGLKEARKERIYHLDEILQALEITNSDNRASIIKRHSASAVKRILSNDKCKVSQYQRPPLEGDTVSNFTIMSLHMHEEEIKESYDNTSLADLLNTTSSDLIEVLEKLCQITKAIEFVGLVEKDTGMLIGSTQIDQKECDLETASAFLPNLILAAEEVSSTLIPNIKVREGLDTTINFNTKSIRIKDITSESHATLLVVLDMNHPDHLKVEPLLNKTASSLKTLL